MLYNFLESFFKYSAVLDLPASQVPSFVSKKPQGSYRNPKFGLPDTFWDKFDDMCLRLKVEPVELAAVITAESGFNPKAINYVRDPNTNKPKLDQFGKQIPQAKGLNQLIWSTAKSLGMSRDVWDNLENISAEEQLVWVEKYFEKNKIAGKSRVDIYVKNFGGFANPDGSLYASKAYIDSHPMKDKFQRPEFQDKAYNQNKYLDKENKGFIAKKDLARLVGG